MFINEGPGGPDVKKAEVLIEIFHFPRLWRRIRHAEMPQIFSTLKILVYFQIAMGFADAARTQKGSSASKWRKRFSKTKWIVWSKDSTEAFKSFLTSWKHFSGHFLGLVHLVTAVLLFRLVLCGSIFLFKGLEKESILKKRKKERKTHHLKHHLLMSLLNYGSCESLQVTFFNLVFGRLDFLLRHKNVHFFCFFLGCTSAEIG